MEPENNPQPAGKTIQEDDDVVGHDNIYIDMDYDDGVVGASIVWCHLYITRGTSFVHYTGYVIWTQVTTASYWDGRI